MGGNKDREFPESEAWAAELTPDRDEVSRSLRKSTGSEAAPGGEYARFAGLDFSGRGI